MNLIAHIDGSSKGNPGESGYGMVLEDEAGEPLEEVGCYIGVATNNIAEYQAFLGCMMRVKAYPVRSLKVYSDSQLLVNQVNGIYRVKQPHLQKLHRKAVNLIREVPFSVEIHYINREKNKAADKLARQAVRLKSDVINGRIDSRGQNG